MDQETKHQENSEEVQFSCFYLGDTLCGFDINLVQEVNDELSITEVPLSPEYVMGIMNLRGQIITVIDIAFKLGMSRSEIQPGSRVIIIKTEREFIGLIVDRVSEVVSGTRDNIAPPPPNLKGLQGKFVDGVIHTKTNELLALLDIEKVLAKESE